MYLHISRQEDDLWVLTSEVHANPISIYLLECLFQSTLFIILRCLLRIYNIHSQQPFFRKVSFQKPDNFFLSHPHIIFISFNYLSIRPFQLTLFLCRKQQGHIPPYRPRAMTSFKSHKKRRDPNAPKQPLTAFFIYSSEERQKVGIFLSVYPSIVYMFYYLSIDL